MQQVNRIPKTDIEKNQNEDIVISKNNVEVMSMEEYKNKKLNEKIEKNLLQSEKDIENGRVKDATEIFEEWKMKYGI